MQANHRILTYRWIAFMLALGYWIYQFDQVLDPTQGFGWQFRYLTIWALSASLLYGIAVLRLSLGRTDHRPETLAGVAAVMNVIVVYLYWKLYFDNPASVNANGPIVWWEEYYLHVLGPILLWIDALVFLGTFRKLAPIMAALVLVVVAYVGWAELIVQPANARPVGTVTSGLPYPFLNNMDIAARGAFYGGTAALSLALVAVGWGVNRLIHR
jgi:hypothetical protein